MRLETEARCDAKAASRTRRPSGSVTSGGVVTSRSRSMTRAGDASGSSGRVSATRSAARPSRIAYSASDGAVAMITAEPSRRAMSRGSVSIPSVSSAIRTRPWARRVAPAVGSIESREATSSSASSAAVETLPCNSTSVNSSLRRAVIAGSLRVLASSLPMSWLTRARVTLTAVARATCVGHESVSGESGTRPSRCSTTFSPVVARPRLDWVASSLAAMSSSESVAGSTTT